MFGMFKRTNLTLTERAALLLSLVQAGLMGYVKHGVWFNHGHRCTVIENWLKHNDREAGLLFSAKMSTTADEMCRYLVSTMERSDIVGMYSLLDRAQHLKSGEFPEIDAQVHTLMAECERTVIAKGLAS